ncbi:MAG: pyruvate kinase [Alistipes sp.]|nr:pyruvate kinase [Alistipes sp.]
MKKTKIVATLSDKNCTPELVAKLIAAGVDVVRVNTAHVTRESAAKIVETVHAVSPATPIMLDTKGPEIRITGIDESDGGELAFRAGDTIRIRGTRKDEKSNRETVYFNTTEAIPDIAVGNVLLIADGEIELAVIDKHEDELVCKFINDGTLRPRKSVNVPGVSLQLPSVTERDRKFIEWAIDNDIDFIAHSFVRSAADVAAVQSVLDERGSKIKIISKIENQEGLDNLDEIIEASYGIMVARGDLGVELPAEAIPTAQRRIVESCIRAKRPVIIATQMLYSMIHSPRPTRAEVSDVASAIYERVDAVMLSEETAMGAYPVESVETMSRIAERIEEDERSFTPMTDMNMVSVAHEITAQVARSAVRASTNLPVKYIVVDTLTGRTGRYLAAFRSHKTVVAVCYTLHAQRILALSYGVKPILRDKSLDDRYHFLADAMEVIDEQEVLRDDDLLVTVGGSFSPERGASYVEIARVADIRERNEKRH